MSIGSRKEIPPLPSSNDFKLSNILKSCETDKLKNVNTSIEISNKRYSKDVSDQFVQLSKIENSLLHKMDSIEINYETLHNKIQRSTSAIEKHGEVGNKLSKVVDQLIKQRARLEKLSNKLKELGEDDNSDEPQISSVKLNQYLDMEQQLAVIGRKQSMNKLEKFKNPAINLFKFEMPTTDISDQNVTIVANDSNTDSRRSSASLVSQLKKYQI